MARAVEPPLYFGDDEDQNAEMARKSALSIREILIGKLNNTMQVTLTPGATSTTVGRDRVCCDTVVQLSPRTASAAAAMASGSVYVTATAGQFTVHHDANPAPDRTFGVSLLG